MKKVELKQTDSVRLRIFALVYFLLLLGLLVYAILDSSYGFVNFINSLGYELAAILFGVVFISPLLLLNKLTTYKLCIVFEDELLRIYRGNDKKATTVRYASIDRMFLNRKRLNELELLNFHSKLLYSFRSLNNGDAIEELVKILTQNITFSKTTQQVKKRVGRYNFITFKR